MLGDDATIKLPLVNGVDINEGVAYIIAACNQMESGANEYFLDGDFANHIAHHANHADGVDKGIRESAAN